MGVSLGGSSDAYPPLDDSEFLDGARVLRAHDQEVLGTNVIQGSHDLLLGRNIIANGTQDNTIIGENVTLTPGVRGSTSIGMNNTFVSESHLFQMGGFMEYRKYTGQVSLANGLVRAQVPSKTVVLGPNSDLKVTRQDTSVATPLQVRSRDAPDQEWELAVEPSEEDPTCRDLVIRASDGTSVVFCSGAARGIE